MIEKTLLIIKPDAVGIPGAVGEILSEIERTGALLHIAELRMVQLSAWQVQDLYREHIGRPYYDGHASFMRSGNCVAAILEGENAVQNVRIMLGPTDPDKARKEAPSSIRARFGTALPFNAAHGSDSVDAAKREAYVFDWEL